MHERRSEAFSIGIRNKFDKMQKRHHTPGYDCGGTDVVYDMGTRSIPFTSADLVRLIVGNLQRPLRILDIGTGAGTFVLASRKAGHDAVGVTAHDYRKSDKPIYAAARKIPDRAYIIGDAHHLDQLPGVDNDYDLIISSMAFMHLVDPFSVLEQAANKLALQGTLAVDYIPEERYEDPPNAGVVIESLTSSGFDVSHVIKADGLPKLEPLVAVRHSIEPVRFLVEY